MIAPYFAISKTWNVQVESPSSAALSGSHWSCILIVHPTSPCCWPLFSHSNKTLCHFVQPRFWCYHWKTHRPHYQTTNNPIHILMNNRSTWKPRQFASATMNSFREEFTDSIPSKDWDSGSFNLPESKLTFLSLCSKLVVACCLRLVVLIWQFGGPIQQQLAS